MKNKKYWIWNAVILIAIFFLTVWSIAREQNLALLPSALSGMRIEYAVIGAALGMLYVLGEAFILKNMFHHEKRRVSFWRCARYACTGFFFSAITPSATGGQPIEMYYMHRDGIPASTSAPMLLTTTILYKIVLVASGILFLGLGWGTLGGFLENSQWLFALGFLVNFLMIVAMLLLLFKSALVEKFLRWLFSLRFLRRYENAHRKVMEFAAQYKEICALLLKHKKHAIGWMCISIGQRLCYLMVTYIVYCAFGLTGYNALEIMLLQGVIAISVDMLPTPGGMGLSEHLSLGIFRQVFGENMILPATLAIRVLIFYLPVVISGMVAAWSHFRGKRI